MFSEFFFVVQIDNNFMLMDNYLATGGGANYCNQRLYVYQFLFVCLFGCSLITKTTSKFQQIFCTYYLRLWLGPAPTAMQYVVYFWSCG